MGNKIINKIKNYQPFVGWIAISAGTIITFILPCGQIHENSNNFLLLFLTFIFYAFLRHECIVATIIVFFLLGITISIKEENHKKTIVKIVNSIEKNRVNKFIIKPLSISQPYRTGYKFRGSVRPVDMNNSSKSKQTLIAECFSPVRFEKKKKYFTKGRIRKIEISRDNSKENWKQPWRKNKIILRIDTILPTEVTSEKLRSSDVVTISKIIRNSIEKRIELCKSPFEREIFRAMILGEREMLPDGIKNSFQRAGIFHILALSGLHISILILFLFGLTKFLPISDYIKRAMILLLIWSYYNFTGSLPTLFRASIMATVLILAPVFQRKNNPINALGLAGIITLIFSPYSIATPGYQLSFGAVFGILKVYPVIESFFSKKSKLYFIYSALAISLSSYLTTLPILIWHFRTISIFGVFENIFAITAVTLAMNLFAGAFIISLFIPTITLPLFRLSFGLIHLINLTTEVALTNKLFIHINRPYVPFLVAYCTLLLLLITRKIKTKELGTILLPLIIIALTSFIIVKRYHNHESKVQISEIDKNGKRIFSLITLPSKKKIILGDFSIPENIFPKNRIVEKLTDDMLAKFEMLILTDTSSDNIINLETLFAIKEPKRILITQMIKENSNLELFLRKKKLELEIKHLPMLLSETNTTKTILITKDTVKLHNNNL